MVITWKPTLMDQSAQEGKYTLQQYSWISSEEVSIHTSEMTTMREIKRRKDMRWVIYTDLLSSMLAISAHTVIKGNEEVE